MDTTILTNEEIYARIKVLKEENLRFLDEKREFEMMGYYHRAEMCAVYVNENSMEIMKLREKVP